MQTNKPEMTKNVHYAEDIKQSFYIICKGKIDEGTKPFSFSKRYGILVCVPQSRYEFSITGMEVVEGDANSCKIGKYR